MQEGRTSYILVHLVEHHDTGYTFRRTRSDWPLHITLVPWFYVQDEDGLESAVASYTSSAQPFSVTVGEDRTYGKRQEIPVNIMADQSELEVLHKGLLRVVYEHGDGYHVDPPPFVGDNFTGHVTHHVKDDVLHRMYPGDVIDVADVTLVRLLVRPDGQFCEIVKHYRLGIDEATA